MLSVEKALTGLNPLVFAKSATLALMYYKSSVMDNGKLQSIGNSN